MKQTKIKIKTPIPTEAQEQKKVFEWAALMTVKYPDLKWMYHIPNGGSRNPIEARHLKEQGVKSGVPDIHLPVPRGCYHGLYIEMKRQEGGRISETQKTWLFGLGELGHKTLACEGAEDAIREIVIYLEGEHDN